MFKTFSLSRGRRERELLRITKENINMLRRIHSKKPAISIDKLEKDWAQNKRFMDNISAYPEDWYLRENQFKSRSNPNISASEKFIKPKNNQQQSKKAKEEGDSDDSKKDDKYDNDFDE